MKVHPSPNKYFILVLLYSNSNDFSEATPDFYWCRRRHIKARGVLLTLYHHKNSGALVLLVRIVIISVKLLRKIIVSI